ncbi:unnamed protein product [Parnassius apollo]|uniref:(apollo) hypothetical protein n=1 Tax=Parnassius apollo TaxID=110799 RepID=A0A8S3WQU8_PARAO|nr:unnamed protein product [Parnassius apollo]
MSKLQRTPPKCPSNPDISLTTSDASYVNTRKRFSGGYDSEFLSALIDEHFNTLDLKITETITNIVTSTISNELAKISHSLSSLNTTISELRDENINLKQRITDLNNHLSEVDTTLSDLNEQSISFDTRLKTVESQVSKDNYLSDKLDVMEIKLAAMEQQARDCNIEISNLPERRGENLVTVIINIGVLINQQIQPSDIILAHRVPHVGENDKRPKNAIIKFKSKILRDNFVASYRAKKGLTSEQLSITGSSNKIYINEHLTLKNKQIFRESREKAKTCNYKYVWYKNGTVLVRKTDSSPVLPIRSLQDLKKIKP